MENSLPGEGSAVLDLCTAFRAMPVGVAWVRIEDETILDANSAFTVIFGYEAREFKTIAEWMEETCPFAEDRALALEAWRACFAAPRGSEFVMEPIQLRILCKNGRIKHILHHGVILTNMGWAIATFTDTDRPEDEPPLPMAAPKSQRKEERERQFSKLDQGEAELDLKLRAWETVVNDRRRQQKALRLSEELLDRTGELAGVGGWEVDLRSGTVSWTAETYRLHAVAPGYQPTLAASTEFYAPEARAMIRGVVEEAIATGVGWDLEAPLIRADGQRIWVRTSGSVEFADGKAIRLIGAFQDVTARIAEQNALKYANERLVLATASGQIGTWDWDIANQNIFWDDRMYRLYGLDPASRSGGYETWFRHLHADDREQAERKLLDAIETKAPYEAEFRVIWEDGTIHHLRAMGQATHDEAGRPIRILGVNWDVTEQHRLATERAERDELFRVTLESVGDGVITTDAQSRVRWMNPVAERLLGWQTAEAAGLPVSTVFKLIHEETREPVLVPLAECLAQETTITLPTNTMLISRDGTEIGIEDSAAPIRDGRGQILGAVLVFHDVTQQRQLTKKAARIMKHDLQLKDEFLSHVSHELRSPLASIYSFSAIIADGLAGEITPEQEEYLKIILKNSRQLRAMIDDLLQVTQSETGKLRIALETTSLAEAMLDAVNMLRGQAAAKGVQLSSDWPAEMPRVFADPTRLRQVLIIMLDNAVKFTPEGGGVRLRAGVSGSDPAFLEVCVSDTGCGIGPEAAERVFEHMYQACESDREARKGLGLGLYIARDLVNRQGGKVWVKSELGCGSRFFFTVPIFSATLHAGPVNPWGVERRRRTEGV